jgi:hypothetical protein
MDIPDDEITAAWRSVSVLVILWAIWNAMHDSLFCSELNILSKPTLRAILARAQ